MHVRCPHCHQPLELADNAGLEHIDCPSCGSALDLSSDATAAYEPQRPLNEAAAETIAGSGEGVLASNVVPGRKFGDYELQAEIARGGMGVVYKARQTRLNRTVAVKMILAGELADQQDVRRFLSEAEAAAGLDHPGIVPVYESGEIDGQHFFSMGFVDGQSLARLLRAGPLPPRRAAELVAQVADAVEYAHQRGVIHRDLKPGNILLDREGHPRVTDFGLAKRVTGDSGLTRTGQALGTPSFMPPEQASGQLDAVGPAADVYALGAVLYAALTGRPPFQAASPLHTLRQVVEQQAVPPRQLNANVPRDLETIALKCLEKEPRKRYVTASELAGELRRYLNGEPIRARPVGRPERIWRWCKRKPALAGLGAAVAGLLALVLVGGAVSYWRISTQYRQIVDQNADLTAKQNELLMGQAKALLATNDAGRRWQAEEALLKAAQIERTPEIRDQYLRCLNAAGFRTVCEMELPSKWTLDSAAFAAPRSSGIRENSGARTLTTSATVLVAGLDGRLLECDAQSGRLLRELTGGATLGDMGTAPTVLRRFRFTFRADGRQFALPSRGFTSVWTWAASLECQGRLKDQHGDDVTAACLEFSQAGNQLAAAVERGPNESEILVYDSNDLALLATWKVPYSTSDLQFCAQDRLLAASVNNSTTSFVKLWRTEQWAEAASLASDVHSYVGFHRPAHLSASVDGRFLVVIGDAGRVRVLRTNCGAGVPPASAAAGTAAPQVGSGATVVASEFLSLDAHAGPVHCAQISPDGRWLLTCGVDDRSLKLWALPLGNLVAQATLPWQCADIRWSSSGAHALLMAGRPKLIELAFPLAQVYPLAALADLDRSVPLDRAALLSGLEFDSQQRWLACGSLAAIDLSNLQEPVYWLPSSTKYHGSPPVAAFSPRGDELYLGRLWELATILERISLRAGAPVDSSETGDDRYVYAMVVGQDGQPLAAGLDRQKQRLLVWEPGSHHQVLQISPELRQSIPGRGTFAVVVPGHLRLSRDASRLALVDMKNNEAERSFEHFLRVFDLCSPRGPAERPRISLRHDSPCVVLSADGKRVAVGQKNKCVVFDADGGHALAEFEGPQAEVKDVALDASGRLLASIGTEGRTVYLWTITGPSRPAAIGALTIPTTAGTLTSSATTGTLTSRATFEIEGARPLVRVALSPGGRWLAVVDLHANVTVVNLQRCREQLRAAGFDLPSPQER